MDVLMSNLHKALISLSTRLAFRKSQRLFLDTVLKWDLCSSIRPKIGKSFHNPELDSLKSEHLEECRVKLVRICIAEANNDITKLKAKFKDMLLSCQEQVSKSDYTKLCNLATSKEKQILTKILNKNLNTKKSWFFIAGNLLAQFQMI